MSEKQDLTALEEFWARANARAELEAAQREAAGGTLVFTGDGNAPSVGSYAEDYAAMYPNLLDYQVHAIRKHGENHSLTDEQMQLEYQQDFNK